MPIDNKTQPILESVLCHPGHMTKSNTNFNKAIRDGRPRPPRHQVGCDIVTRECACQISWWSVEKWRRYYILKFRGNTFRWPMTLTFDLKFWKYLSVTVYPYVICMPSFIMIGWEMAEILHFEILRKHGQTHTHTHTNRHGHYNTSPSPYGGRGNNLEKRSMKGQYLTAWHMDAETFPS